MRVLVIGGGAREHAICKVVSESDSELYVLMKNANPGIKKLAKKFILCDEKDSEKVISFARECNVDLAVIGPETPEEAGISDILQAHEIAVASPSRKAAEIETNKEFMRWIMKKYAIPGNVRCKTFSNAAAAAEFIELLEGEVAVKPLGLTGGKGVMLAGDHFKTTDDTVAYAKEVIERSIGGYRRVLIEEKLVGEEFTLQAFCDGSTIYPMPSVQDHKRLLPGDKGPNTGGMGSYSHKSGLLPFMRPSEYEEAATIMQKIIEALRRERREYRGAIYGQFMLTGNGVRVIEINARFGDPEAMNVLPLLKTNFVDICMAMIDGTLSQKRIKFDKKSTVCKYVVPRGYGINPEGGKSLIVNEHAIQDAGGMLFYASVNEEHGNICTTSSRSLAVTATADEITDAEAICESCLKYVNGDVFMRHDIGTKELVEKRIKHMDMLRGLA